MLNLLLATSLLLTLTLTEAQDRSTRGSLLSSGESGTVDGYLMDLETWGTSASVYRTSPGSYTVAQATTATHASKQFTLLVPFDESGNYQSGSSVSYRPYYNFTTAANAVFAAFLAKWKYPHTNHGNLRVHVQGTLNSNASFLINATAGEDAIWTATVDIQGYLADLLCVNRIIGFDGANMVTSPQNHWVHCAILTACIPDGYTILIHTAGQTSYGPMYNLTALGNTQSVVWMRTLADRQNILVNVRGHLDSSRRMSITEGPSFSALSVVTPSPNTPAPTTAAPPTPVPTDAPTSVPPTTTTTAPATDVPTTATPVSSGAGHAALQLPLLALAAIVSMVL